MDEPVLLSKRQVRTRSQKLVLIFCSKQAQDKQLRAPERAGKMGNNR